MSNDANTTRLFAMITGGFALILIIVMGGYMSTALAAAGEVPPEKRNGGSVQPQCASSGTPDMRFSVFFEGATIGLDLGASEIVALVAEHVRDSGACFIDVVVDPDNLGVSWRREAWQRAAAVNNALRAAVLPAGAHVAVMARDPASRVVPARWGGPSLRGGRLEIVVRAHDLKDALSYDLRD